MKFKWIYADGELKRDIQMLHDREKQKAWLDSLGQKYNHFELQGRYRFCHTFDDDECPNCDARVDSDWDYCPFCGCELNKSIDILEDTIEQVKKRYQGWRGEPMPDELEKEIKFVHYIKVWLDDKDK